jgi:hypothetical protein
VSVPDRGVVAPGVPRAVDGVVEAVVRVPDRLHSAGNRELSDGPTTTDRMHRKLFKSGHGAAVHIDVQTRAQLQLEINAPLHVGIEGDRIVIQRCKCELPEVSEANIVTATTYHHLRLNKLLRELEARGIGPASFDQLSHDGEGLFSFWGRVNVGLPVDAITVARLETFADKLRAGLVLAAAVRETLEEVPSCEQVVKLVAA